MRRALTDLLGGLRARLAARPDTEHEQAIVRLVVAVLLVLYLLPHIPRSRACWSCISPSHFAVGALVLLRVLSSSRISPVRRVLALSADFATVTCYMAYFGEDAAPLFLMYVWMTFANGFRFGKRYS